MKIELRLLVTKLAEVGEISCHERVFGYYFSESVDFRATAQLCIELQCIIEHKNASQNIRINADIRACLKIDTRTEMQMIEIAVHGEIRVHRHQKLSLIDVVVIHFHIGCQSLQIVDILITKPIVGISYVCVGIDLMLRCASCNPRRTVIAAKFSVYITVARAVGEPFRTRIHRMDVAAVRVFNIIISAQMIHIVFVIDKSAKLSCPELIDSHHVKGIVHKRRALIVVHLKP